MTKKKSEGGGIGETLRTVLYAVLIAIVLRTFAYEPFSIPSGSMLPTLMVGDYLFVSKFSYGYSRHSFPMSLAPINGRVFASQPERGDVAVFKLPTDNSTDYIKRIIGLPGDKIQVEDGVLNINGAPVDREKLGEGMVRSSGYPIRIAEYLETLPNDVTHQIWERGDDEVFDNTPVFTVPDDHYFAMGDNRDSSQDSRSQNVGFIPEENLVGRAEFIFFSNNGSARFWEIWKWPSAIRFDRIFQTID
ncbi:MAG: signal peptidase I [Pseudomonadota bacterium]